MTDTTNILPNQFECNLRFMFDLNAGGAKLYRDQLDRVQRVKMLDWATSYAAKGDEQQFKQTLERPEFSGLSVAGEGPSAEGHWAPVVHQEAGFVSVEDVVGEAAGIFNAEVLGGEDSKPPVFESFTLDFRQNSKSSDFSSEITCKQRVWNPTTGRWEWIFNYTMLADFDYYAKEQVDAGLVSSLQVSSEVLQDTFVSFRIAAQLSPIA